VYDLIERVISRLTPLAQAQGVKLPLPDFVAPLLVNGDADKLQQALGNLVDNGLRHTPAGGKVLVTAVQDAHLVRISVTDTGPGIPPEDLPHLFDRFWRGDKSRSRHSGGSGLGLSIVQQIAELHGGAVTAVSPDGMGATFTLSLPLASAKRKKKG
jgi:two-component system, OmpR family, sensor histidine kinase BaeS